MTSPQAGRLVEIVLRCYPARWRRRHAEEAAELAALLIADGSPAGSIARSYLAGAAREWLMPPPGLRLRLAVCALLAVVCSLGISAGLLARTAPAHAASTSHAHCQPVPGPVSPLAHHQQARGWHVRSC